MENNGTDFLQRFVPSDTILILTHLFMFYNALLHASYFKGKVVAVMHLWARFPPYRNFLQGENLSSKFFEVL